MMSNCTDGLPKSMVIAALCISAVCGSQGPRFQLRLPLRRPNPIELDEKSEVKIECPQLRPNPTFWSSAAERHTRDSHFSSLPLIASEKNGWIQAACFTPDLYFNSNPEHQHIYPGQDPDDYVLLETFSDTLEQRKTYTLHQNRKYQYDNGFARSGVIRLLRLPENKRARYDFKDWKLKVIRVDRHGVKKNWQAFRHVMASKEGTIIRARLTLTRGNGRKEEVYFRDIPCNCPKMVNRKSYVPKEEIQNKCCEFQAQSRKAFLKVIKYLYGRLAKSLENKQSVRVNKKIRRGSVAVAQGTYEVGRLLGETSGGKALSSYGKNPFKALGFNWIARKLRSSKKSD